ncbi:MAG: L7Ae/L30e/S12e/Gadd45 family ribosomal protein [Bacilli bacterium]
MNKTWLNSLSLAMASGNVAHGDQVMKSIRSNKAYLVLIASDASNNTKKQFKNKSLYYEVPCYEVVASSILSHAIGKQGRMYLAITSKDFAQLIINKMKEDYDGKKENFQKEK